jgi:hypothetical protein
MMRVEKVHGMDAAAAAVVVGLCTGWKRRCLECRRRGEEEEAQLRRKEVLLVEHYPIRVSTSRSL